MNPDQYCLAYITLDALETAQKLAADVLEAGLGACVNVIPQMHSFYRWQGRIEHSQEVIFIIKTKVTHWENLTKFIAQRHPYQVPCILQIPITAGNTIFLNWIDEQIQ